MTKRILVIKLGALGDIFLTFDVFHALRQNHPGAHFTFMTRPAYGTLAGQMPWFDEVWTDAGPKWWQVGQWLALRRKLRAGRFDRVYDLQSNERTGRYFQMLGKPRPEWVGTVRGCSHQGAPLRPQRLPATQRLFNLVALAGVPSAGRAPLDWLNGSLAEFALPEKFAVLIPGCSPNRPEKRWPAEHFAELARRMAGTGVNPLAVGTAAEAEAVQVIAARVPGVINLLGRTSFGQLAALARRAQVVVSNDTGPAHIMATVGAPTLVLFSAASDPLVSLPRGPHVAFMQEKVLGGLSAERVWHTLNEKLARLE